MTGPRELLRDGVVIPAHPLALTADRSLDERRQRALTRYYVDAGAGGIAVGVHTTQFAIREAGLHEQVLALAAEATRAVRATRPFVMVAGVVGPTAQAVREAAAARAAGYDVVLLGLGVRELKDAVEEVDPRRMLDRDDERPARRRVPDAEVVRAPPPRDPDET